jgi:hypothetical protein
MRFGKKGKLSPRFIGPFQILRKVGTVAYELALPPALEHIHNVFHISVLRPYRPDFKQVIDYQPIEIQDDLTYIETPVQIVGRQVKILRNKEIPTVKVIWRNHHVEEATWELESEMKQKYPHLFET